jgi:hypothetical protein
MSDKLYIIRCHKYTKIGIASNVKNRLKTLQTGNPYPLELIDSFEFDDPLMVEGLLHRKYDQAWVQGEWFELSDAQFSELLDICRNFDESKLNLLDDSVPAMLLRSALSYCVEAGLPVVTYNADGRLVVEIHGLQYADGEVIPVVEEEAL